MKVISDNERQASDAVHSQSSPQDVSRSSRLSAILSREELAPFVRAYDLSDLSLYWLPVKEFPVPQKQRSWLLEFLKRLGLVLESESGLREENFLPFKTLYPDYLDRFTQTGMEYLPLSGMSISPDAKPVANPSFEDIKELVGSSSKSGAPVDVNQFMPDILYWFLIKKGLQQRQDFFGSGGMITLYLKPDAACVAPPLRIPKVVSSRPDFSKDIEGQVQATYSMKDGFLQASKELFGKSFEHLPIYQGIRFVLPILSSKNFTTADVETRECYLQLFEGMFWESPKDRGMLLVLKDAAFDRRLVEILQSMEEDGYKYADF
ncbi:hypothetical protein [Terriglobus sp.]|uniref:hypothetical protein n=1 Tax=Terriglobus sp. TaxID=1889013 RepID=UPI003AFFC9D1